MVVELAEHDGFAWFFQLPDGECNDKTTSRYGFLCNVSVTNRGVLDNKGLKLKRYVSLKDWYLQVKIRDGELHKLEPISISASEVKLGKEMKTYPVLWQKGVYLQGDPILESGCGIAYFVGEFYRGDDFGLLSTSDTMTGQLTVRTNFRDIGDSRELTFKKVDLGEVKKFIDDIGKIDFLSMRGMKDETQR